MFTDYLEKGILNEGRDELSIENFLKSMTNAKKLGGKIVKIDGTIIVPDPNKPGETVFHFSSKE